MKKYQKILSIVYCVAVTLFVVGGIALFIAGVLIQDADVEEEKKPYAYSSAISLVQFLSIERADEIRSMESFGKGKTLYFYIIYDETSYYRVQNQTVKKINAALYEMTYNQLLASDSNESYLFGTERSIAKHRYSREDIEWIVEEANK